MGETGRGRLLRRLFGLAATALVIALAAGTLAFTVDRLQAAVAGLAGDAPAASQTPIADPSRSSLAGGPNQASSSPSASGVPSASGLPSGSPSETLEPSPTPTPKPKAFSMDLYRPADFVGEKTKVWCLPAAMQTSINIMRRGSDRTATTQRRLFDLARSLSPAPDGAAEPEGWARGLTRLHLGRYEVQVHGSIRSAIQAAAKALRTTNRPVGLLVWRGAHSWVMSGFKATADPALTSHFTVTAVWIEDVWWPRFSTIWGYSRPPDTLVPFRRLKDDFLPWRRPQARYPSKDGRYVIVVPTR